MSHQNNFSGIILVTTQFLILGYFTLSHPIRQPFGPQDIVAYTFILSGILLGASALFAIRKSRFRIIPEPDIHAILVTNGPYAFIRHPMYTALILFTFGLFLNFPVITHFLAFALLFITLNLKLTYEETLLTQACPSYRSYQAGTRKLFPFLY